MAEVIAGFAAVSSILQVIDFAAKVTHHTIHLVRDSKEALDTKWIVETERLAREYQAIGNAVSDNAALENRSLPELRRAHDLAEQCKAQSGALLDLLQDLKVDPDSTGTFRIVQSLQKAIQTQRKRKRIEQECKSLESSNNQLSSEFLLLLRLGQHEQFNLSSKILQTLHENHDNSVRAVLNAKHEICQTIDRTMGETFEARSVPRGSNKTVKYRQQIRATFLGTLLFKEIHARRDAIAPAYQKTFDWALNDDSSGLRQWLSGGSGIYWVSGKAGSGKSTLMRHLVQSDTTKLLLDQWVQPSNSALVTAEFYFWYAGTKLQKSVEGLLRGLLFQILSHCEGGEQITFPGQWQFARDYQKDTKDWTKFELVNGIRRLAAACERKELTQGNAPCRFCFFIDGLDEFKGDHGQLISLLRDLTKGKQIKICASSRPWNAFRSAFEGSCPSLKLEDLTRSDIASYVRGSLQSTVRDLTSSDYGTSAEQTSPEMSTMIDEVAQLIVRKSEGVFIWVEMVVKSVQEGLWEGDQVAFLYQRVEAFPEDLEEFFDLILDRVNGVYRQNTAMALSLAFLYIKENDVAWSESDFTEFWLIREDAKLIADDQRFARNVPVRSCSNEDLQTMEADTRTFLNACCKDLVYLPKEVHEPAGQGTLIKRAEFLHRTVFDFLSSDEMQQRLGKDVPQWFGSSETLRQMAMSRCKLIFTDEPMTAQRRFNAAASLQCHDFSHNDKDGRPALDESMILQYHQLGKIYRDTLSATPNFPGFRIDNRRVREVFVAFQCNRLIIGDQQLKAAAYRSELNLLLAAALGLHSLHRFRIEKSSYELLQFLFDVGARACVHIWKKFVVAWMALDRKFPRVGFVHEDADAVLVQARNLVVGTALDIIEHEIVDCGSDDKESQRRMKETPDSREVESSRMAFLQKALSALLKKQELDRLLAVIQGFHATDIYTCRYEGVLA